MPSQDERLAKQRAATRERIEELKAQQRRIESQQAARERRRRQERLLTVGKLVEAAGLLAWDDTTLAGLFQALARLKDVPDPVPLLEALLADDPTLVLAPLTVSLPQEAD